MSTRSACSLHRGARCIIALLVLFGSGGCTVGEDVATDLLPPNPSAGTAPGTSPSIQIEHHFGTVRPATTHVHRFWVTNPTLREWTIDRVTHGCSCTVADIESKVIPPNARRYVDVSFTASSKYDDVSKEVQLHLADSDVPAVRLAFTARIRDALSAFPGEIDFGRVGMGHVAQHVLVLECQSAADDLTEPLRITSCPDWIRTEIHEVNSAEPGITRWHLHCATLTDHLSEGRQNGNVALAARAQDGALSLTVPASIIVEPSVIPVPARFVFGRVPAGETRRATVLVRFASENVPTVEQVKLKHSLGPELHLQWVSTDGTAWKLQAEYSPQTGRPVSGVKGDVELTVGGDHPSRVVLPVIAIGTQRHESEE